MLPNAIAGAVRVRPQAAGTASGVLGFVQMAIGAGIVQIAAAVQTDAGTLLPLALVMVAAVAVYALAQLFMVSATGTSDGT